MANTIEILVEATDKTKGALASDNSSISGLESGFERLTGISLSAAGAMALAGTAVSAVVDYTKEAVEETVKYADEVKELARVGGLSFEEASGLIQIAEGMGISYKDLVTGLGNATKKGVDVSIENLLLLADEYNKLNDPVTGPIDRARWLTENFGAAGANLAPMFEAGRAGVVTAMEGVNEALILDEADIQSVSDYELALADLKDSFDGLKTKVGLEVIPVLLGLLDVLNNEDGARGTGFQRMFGRIETAASNAAGAVDDLSAALGNLPGGVITDIPAPPMGGGGFGGGYATGGYVAGGNSYIVGERGPELFTPSGGGQITPNGQLGGGNTEMDYDRMADAFVQALEKSSLVR